MAIKKGTLTPKVERYLMQRVDEQVSTAEIYAAVKMGKKAHSAINSKLGHLVKQERLKRISPGIYKVLPSIKETRSSGVRVGKPKNGTNGNHHAATNSEIRLEPKITPAQYMQFEIAEAAKLRMALQQIALMVEQLNLILEQTGIIEKVDS